MENNTLALLVADAAAFAAAPLSASADTATALLFRVAGAEQSTATAVVDIAFGVLLRRFKGIDKNSIGGGRGGRLKNYHTTANSLQKAGYSFDLQATWLAPLRNAGKLSTWGQSVKNALAALESLQLIQAASSDSSSDSSDSSSSDSSSSDSSNSNAVSTALSDADRAGTIAVELIGLMSPRVFDLLAAAVSQHMENDKAAQQRRNAAAAKRQEASDQAVAAREKRAKADKDAEHIAELRRAADAADLAAIAADQAAKQPNATAATKKRAARLLKKAQQAGNSYLTAAAEYKAVAA